MSAAGRLLRFAAVGLAGFAVDAGLTELAIAAGAGPFVARVGAIAAAIATTWWLNRRLTWRSEARGLAAAGEGARYVAVALAGTAVNYGVYAVLLALLPDLRPALAVAAGSAAAMVVTFLGYQTLVFVGRGPRSA